MLRRYSTFGGAEIRMSLNGHLERFLGEYLTDERRASPHTIAAYSDSLRLFLAFLVRKTGRPVTELAIADMNAATVLEFLDSLEAERAYRTCSRNARLTAIRSFCRMLAGDGLISAGCTILGIAGKRTEPREVRRLTDREMEAILAAPDREEWSGRRDYALLLTLYNTGARVSEIISLRREQVRLEGSCVIRFWDARNGERIVPLWLRTIQTLKTWFDETEAAGRETVFPTVRGRKLSDDGVGYLLQRAVEGAARMCPSLATRKVTPGMIRHTAALHFLEAGVEADVVARWLGHRSDEGMRLYRRAVNRAVRVGTARA